PLGRRPKGAGVLYSLAATKPIGPINRSAAHRLEDDPDRQGVPAVRRDLDDTETVARSLPLLRTATGKDRTIDIGWQRGPARLRWHESEHGVANRKQPASPVAGQV